MTRVLMDTCLVAGGGIWFLVLIFLLRRASGGPFSERWMIAAMVWAVLGVVAGIIAGNL